MGKEKKIFIDSRFSPPQIDQTEYEVVQYGVPIGTTAVDEDDGSAADQNEQDGEGDLTAPTNLTVIGQQVHTGTGGSQVVDIIIQFDDVDGATKYNARYSKIG